MNRSRLLWLLFALLGLSMTATAQVNITTEAYDNSRSGSNLNETILTTANVNSNQFGKLFSQTINGSAYAQPLYVANVSINGATHNVVYVATMNDVVYAFDADSNTGANASPLWTVSFTNPSAGVNSVPTPSHNIDGNIGIESTPVIDMSSGTMYLVVLTAENGTDVYRLHALDIRSGAEKFGGPVVISGSVSGSGSASTNGTITFDPTQHQQRGALALVNGTVLVTFGSFGDDGPYHGWIMGYNAKTLSQTLLTCITPNGARGALWMSGRGPAIDSNNNVYFMTANGDYDGQSNFSDSFVKYSTSSGFALADWFTPDDFATLESQDEDLGSSSPLLIPGTNVLVGGGKEGILYLVNAADMGHEVGGNSQIVQSFSVGSPIFSGPAFYNRTTGAGPTLYLWPNAGFLTAYQFNGSTLDTSASSQSTMSSYSDSFAAAIAVSANGSTAGSGIVWAYMPGAPNEDWGGTIAGVLRAFDANNLGNELWDSTINASRDGVGTWAKFRAPVVTNGKVYVTSFANASTGANAALEVYGLLPTASSTTSTGSGGSGSSGSGSSGSGSGSGSGSTSNPPPTPTATAKFISPNTSTAGNWQTSYGADGYSIAASGQSLPSYATLAVQNSSLWTWTANTTAQRALEVPGGGRIASCWYGAFTFNVNFTDGNTHQLALYLLDWDNRGRSEFVQILDAGTQTVLDTESVSGFSSGIYLSWNISGNVLIQVTNTAGPNQVVSGIFFGGGLPSTSSTAPAVAVYAGTDQSTEGNWTGNYGNSGYDIEGVPPSVPSRVVFNVQNAQSWTWSSSTNDLRALQVPGSNSGIAATWFNSAPPGKVAFSMGLNFMDGQTHQVALYALDWDNRGRAETIQVVDTATGAVLDSRSISNFVSGVYQIWDLSGNVTINFYQNAGPNAVVSAIFFDTPAAPSSSVQTAGISAAFGWQASSGATSYNVYRSASSSGPWSLLGSTASLAFKDTTVVAGQTYNYEITAIVNGAETAPFDTFTISVP